MRLIHTENLEDIALGAAVLGGGSRGDPDVAKQIGMEALRTSGPVQLVLPDEISDDCLVATSALIGTPMEMVEKLPKGTEVVGAFLALQTFVDRAIDYTAAADGDGLKSTTPFAVAARLRIPMVDADGIGGAGPEMQMVIPTIYGIAAGPMAIADEKGNISIIDAVDPAWTDRLARTICTEMGSTAMIAACLMSGRQLKASMTPGTLTRAERIGQHIRQARQQHQNPIEALRKLTGGVELFRGNVVDVQRRTESGCVRGEATFQGTGKWTGSQLTLRFENEHLVAVEDRADLITVLDPETAEPVTTKNLQYGVRAVILGMQRESPARSYG
ncbi:MAG TPA: DUF917 domain-containing protein [Chloroflexota bacterium]|nr:DUF917 domain-containing protein [Chloroflexota bacterium]